MSLSYDPLMRLQALTGASTTNFAYDGLDMVGEYDASNALLRRYVFGPGTDEPLVQYEGADLSTRRWLHADERGSIVAISDDAGNKLTINSYDEYGKPGAANAGRFQYTGQAWLPELGAYYYKARIYEPALGRFLQTDPIGYADSPNLYQYVLNDPVNLSDPLGLQEEIVVTAPRLDLSAPPAAKAVNLSSGTAGANLGNVGGLQSGDPVQKLDPQKRADEIVITAFKKRSLGGVRINLYGVPQDVEQLWIGHSDFTVVLVPNVMSRGKHGIMEHRPAYTPKDVAFIIHTHPDWADPYPEYGDYLTARLYPVYGITPDSVWVLRQGMTDPSIPPVTLYGPSVSR